MLSAFSGSGADGFADSREEISASAADPAIWAADPDGVTPVAEALEVSPVMLGGGPGSFLAAGLAVCVTLPASFFCSFCFFGS